LALTLAERADISRGIAFDSSIREIARLLKRFDLQIASGYAGMPTQKNGQNEHAPTS